MIEGILLTTFQCRQGCPVQDTVKTEAPLVRVLVLLLALALVLLLALVLVLLLALVLVLRQNFQCLRGCQAQDTVMLEALPLSLQSLHYHSAKASKKDCPQAYRKDWPLVYWESWSQALRKDCPPADKKDFPLAYRKDCAQALRKDWPLVYRESWS